jgi:A/G-specific adenine glycosylase
VGLLFDDVGRVLLQKRPAEGMLGGMWEFPGGKLEEGESPEAACLRELREELAVNAGPVEPVGTVKHAYSHFQITLHGFRSVIEAGAPVSQTGAPIAWVTREQLADYPMPRASRKLWEVAASKMDT